MPPDREILNGDGGKEAFGAKIFPFRVLLISIFLFDMYLKDAVLAVDGGEFEIFQDKLRQQKLNDRQETLQN